MRMLEKWIAEGTLLGPLAPVNPDPDPRCSRSNRTSQQLRALSHATIAFLFHAPIELNLSQQDHHAAAVKVPNLSCVPPVLAMKFDTFHSSPFAVVDY